MNAANNADPSKHSGLAIYVVMPQQEGAVRAFVSELNRLLVRHIGDRSMVLIRRYLVNTSNPLRAIEQASATDARRNDAPGDTLDLCVSIPEYLYRGVRKQMRYADWKFLVVLASRLGQVVPVDDAAAQLGISRNTLRTRLCRLRYSLEGLPLTVITHRDVGYQLRPQVNLRLVSYWGEVA